MKKNKIPLILAILFGSFIVIISLCIGAFFGLKVVKKLKDQIHISFQINGNQFQNGNDQASLFPFQGGQIEPEKPEQDIEHQTGEQSEEQTEAQTEEQTEESQGITGNDEFFGMFGQDNELAKALQEGLKEHPESENPFLKEDFKSHLGTDHKNHKREEFTGPYYDNICDSIDETVSYGIERKYYEYIDKEKDITVQLSCVNLSGDIPGVENLNKQIYQQTVEFAMMYAAQSGRDSKKLIQVDSYITFNDESTMSIILDELYETSSGRYMDLYDLNLNLATGTIMKDDMLKVDSDFVKVFRNKSAEQNGKENPGLDKLDDDMLQNYLKNEFTNIIFYTPLGMEIGVNYEVNNTVGWVTVTFQDYEKYLNAV